MYMIFEFDKARMFTLAAAAMAGIFSASVASAATVTVNQDNSTPLSTTAISGVTTSGTSTNDDSDMDGLLATATFASAMDQQLTFADGTTGAGNFTLTQSGNTFQTAFEWSLTVASGFTLTSLLLQGGPGDTVFDLTTPDLGPPTSTDASGAGRTFTESSNLSGAIDVTYSNPVGVTPDAPVGDLYESMFIDLSGLTGGGLSFGQTLVFSQDTDNLSISGDITSAVPLPAAAWMLIAALGGLGLMRRRTSV